ncbi:DNA repair endonuclease XPF [Achlya hypogyna]|uniref:DNA repair endonuclease XPF n=1 Tax=Achlya hypogyna TaxID=1202772 RepID=A0A1V9ZK59_ACHHY|nr:DNA repair endonuclease XPF [Achlya hypogyna]
MAPYWLDFEKEMMENLLLERDIMVILANGLAQRSLLTNFLRLHCAPTNLVLCLNATDSAELYIESLEAQGVPTAQLPKARKPSARHATCLPYKEGGCFFITSRILVVDLLKQTIDTPMITGLLVGDAHRVTDTSVEAFILRLFRESNRSGFVKAFSEDAYAFSNGFHKVEQAMKLLYLRKLLLYPRFHMVIHSVLAQHEPEVFEIDVALSPPMKDMQAALLVALEATLNELKRSCKDLDETELTKPSSSCSRNSAIWHRLPHKTKQLTGDLTVLRQLLAYSTRYDAITFYSFLLVQKAQNGQQRAPSPWLFTAAADRLPTAAKKRLYQLNKTKSAIELTLEPNAIWHAVEDLLREIRDTPSAAAPRGGTSTLIMVRDERTCSQLREYLYFGGTDMLRRRFRSYLQQKGASSFSTEHQLQLQACGIAPATTGPKAAKRKAPAEASPGEMASYGLSLEELVLLSHDGNANKATSAGPVGLLARDDHLVFCTYAQAKKCATLLEDLQPAHRHITTGACPRCCFQYLVVSTECGAVDVGGAVEEFERQHRLGEPWRISTKRPCLVSSRLPV